MPATKIGKKKNRALPALLCLLLLGAAALTLLPQLPAIPEAESSFLLPSPLETDDSQLPLPLRPQSSFPAAESSSTAPIEEEFIPSGQTGAILTTSYHGDAGGVFYIPVGNGFIKNNTELARDEVQQLLLEPLLLPLPAQKSEPLVLIVHTHTTEAYEISDGDTYDKAYTARSRDDSKNMNAVGEAMTRILREAGIGVIHDTTQHDYPSYNDAYANSRRTIESYLEKYPSIQIVLDVHRDAIEMEDGTRIKPMVEIEGKNAAQIMIISGCDDGTMNMPHWQSSLRFSAALQAQMENDHPGLTRPVLFCYRRYNMDLTPASALLEIGGHANTLEEAVYAGELCAQSLVRVVETLYEEEKDE